MKISEPGLFCGFPEPTYRRDPCPEPSLTQSTAKIMLDRSPLHAWYAHPRLNPDFVADDDTKFDIGNVAHALMIGRGKAIEVLDFDDWRTKAAKEARDAASAKGKLAVLGKHFARADKMVTAARQQLELRGLGRLFRPGDGATHGEVVLAARETDPRGTIWLRQMVDWLTPDLLTFADFKTTDMSVAPHGLGRMMVNAGWDVQGAFAERLLDILDPQHAGRRRFFFVAQETEVPYALNVVELSEATLTMGRKKVSAAVRLWAACMASNTWPGYPLEVIVPEYPSYAEASWLTREETEFAQTSAPQRTRGFLGADHLMAG